MTEQNVTGQEVNPWLTAAKSITPETVHAISLEPAPDQQAQAAADAPVFLSAHGGAGATSWASILGGIDGGALKDWEKENDQVVLVARATLDGVDAAKLAVATHGADRFACVLMVASTPGRLPRLITNELKVLSGGVVLVMVPWEPGLLVRRAARAGTSDIPPKELTKIITGLTEAGITIQGETK